MSRTPLDEDGVKDGKAAPTKNSKRSKGAVGRTGQRWCSTVLHSSEATSATATRDSGSHDDQPFVGHGVDRYPPEPCLCLCSAATARFLGASPARMLAAQIKGPPLGQRLRSCCCQRERPLMRSSTGTSPDAPPAVK